MAPIPATLFSPSHPHGYSANTRRDPPPAPPRSSSPSASADHPSAGRPRDDYLQDMFKRWADRINNQTSPVISDSKAVKPMISGENPVNVIDQWAGIRSRLEEGTVGFFLDATDRKGKDKGSGPKRTLDASEIPSTSIEDELNSLKHALDMPTVDDFIRFLQSCRRKKRLQDTMFVYQHMCYCGMECHLYAGNNLVAAFVECGDMSFALQVFRKLDNRTEYSWNYIIRGFSDRGDSLHAVSLFWKMFEDGVPPSKFTLVSFLKACSKLKDVEKGQEIYLQVIKLGLESDYFIGNILVDFYAKCGSLAEAENVFTKLPTQDTVSWTALISGYIENGLSKEALDHFEEMQERGISVDPVTCACGLRACGSVRDKGKGKKIHSQIIAEGFEEDPYIGNALVDMYIKCGLFSEAEDVFDELCIQDIVSWTALIAGYADQGENEKAMSCYRQMHEQCLLPNNLTLASCLKACANRLDPSTGKRLHIQVLSIAQLGTLDVITSTALIDMYAKCGGSMVYAQEVFDATTERDIIGWNALITGYARQGEAKLVFEMFNRMIDEGIQPDGITFLSILAACNQMGSVEKGRLLFNALSKGVGIEPTIKHYNCMVDLFGQSGRVKEALIMLRNMPFTPDLVAWTTLLAACRKWGNVEIGRQAFEAALSLDVNHVAAYNSMFNLYVDANMWEEAKKIESMRAKIESMRANLAVKEPDGWL